MPSSLHPLPVERARPLLGTLVAIRAAFADTCAAHEAVEAAFAEVALIHRLMSFHETDSDVSRLNRRAAWAPVYVDPRTFEVLCWAQALAADTRGCFDVTIAPRAVRAGALPRPASPFEPDPRASWRDIELIEALSAVVFHRPLWIDLGGVAKGYAVDRAIERLKASDAEQAQVNAGGDLRVCGPAAELVLLRTGGGDDAGAAIELRDGAVASSGGEPDRERAPGLHLDGRGGPPAPFGRFVSVVAQTCMVADALAKVAIADPDLAAPTLRRFGASAYLFDAGRGWRGIAEAA